MIALFIIGGILLLIIFLLVSSVSVHIKHDEQTTVTVRYLFFKKSVSSDDENVSKSHKKRSEKQKPDYLKTLFKEKGAAAAVKELVSILKSCVKSLGSPIKHLRVPEFSLLISVATDDAAKTAVEYGAVCAAVFPCLNAARNIFKFGSSTAVSVESDFCSTESRIKLETVLKLRLVYLLCAAIKILFAVIKLKYKEAASASAKTR